MIYVLDTNVISELMRPEPHRPLWVRLHEKGGKRHEMPSQHNNEAYLHAYIDGYGLAPDPGGHCSARSGTGQLTTTPLVRTPQRRLLYAYDRSLPNR